MRLTDSVSQIKACNAIFTGSSMQKFPQAAKYLELPNFISFPHQNHQPSPAERLHLHIMVAEQRAKYHAADYWKLPLVTGSTQSDVLKGHIDKPGGRHYTSATTRARLLELVKRTTRGLRCYDGDSPTELLHFISQRGINSTSPNTKKKQELIAILEAADEETTFDRLLDLPIELRVYIYELHFASYTCSRGAIESATPPPITQTNAQVRKETVKLFYSSCEFQFDFSSTTYNTSLDIDGGTAAMINTLPHKYLSNIRKMRIRVTWKSKSRPEDGEWDIGLPPGGRGKLSMHPRKIGGGIHPANQEMQRKICRFVDKESRYIGLKKLPTVLANLVFFINCRAGSMQLGAGM